MASSVLLLLLAASAIHVPKDLDHTKRYPLVISLHGEYSDPRLDLRRILGGARDVPFLVASPGRVEERDVYDLLAEMKATYPIDEDRVYLAGTSSSAAVALQLVLKRPDVWAALALLCPDIPAPLADLLPNTANVPMQLFHGELDPLIPVQTARAWQKRLLDAGVNVEYVEYPRMRHNVWDLAYANGRIFEWFAAHPRNRLPSRVRFSTRLYKNAAAYWVRLDRLSGRGPASIDAALPTPNQAVVTTKDVDAFTMTLTRVTRISIDGASVAVKAGQPLSFHRVPAGWRAGLSRPGPGEKGLKAEGPLSEILATKPIYVYGTADKPSEEERQRREDVAKVAAQTSTVQADRDVSPADEGAANLILFGTKETNTVLARLAPTLPVSLNASAADYGLTYIWPDHGRYIVVSSGLPWWTGAEEARRGVRGGPSRVLDTFGDFVFFKGSLQNVVAEGLFDSHWNMPARDAATIKATGAVTFR
jgi:predicted esterase